MPAHVPTAHSAHVNPAGPDAWSVLGWREIVLALAVLLGAYVVLVFLRLRRLGRPPAPGDPAPATPAVAVADPDPFAVPPAIAAREVPLDDYEANLPWVKAPVVSDEQRRLQLVESEVVALRDQVEALRATVSGLAEELREKLEQRGPAITPLHHLSPLYGDAMQMAIAGHDVTTISERCGIARAEAELVVALAQQSRQTGEGEDDGDGGAARY